MKPAATDSALGWLGREASFRALTDRAERLLALQADLRRIAPALDLVAMGVEQETLTVGTPGAAAAAKLRQQAPTILAGLNDRGWQVKRIRFRPQPRGFAPPPPPTRPRADIPAGALAEFAALGEQTSSDRLKEALTHLVRSRTGGRGRR